MDSPHSYQKVITKGNLVLEYFSTKVNSPCCWYALKEDGKAYEILTSSENKEIIEVYQDGQLIYLNEALAKSPMLEK